ncbi:MAG: amidohydrolase [Candidatus Norongarragalinales archaeon]
MGSLLVKNALVVTQDSQRRILRDCDVLVQGNSIAKVGRNLRENTAKIDGKGKILVPGLINTHTHLAMTLLRGYGEGLALNEWLKEKIWPVEKKLKPSDVRAGAILGCAEMICTGTTAFADMYYHPDETAKAAVASGLRANVSFPVLDFLGEGRKQFLRAKKFLRHHFRSGRIELSVGPHSIYSCSRQLLEETARAAGECGAMVQIHLSEHKGEVSDCLHRSGQKPAFYLNSTGLLNERLLAAHCVWLDATEIELFKQKRASVSLNPVSNLKLGSGIAPARRMMENGVGVSLGTDGAASNNSLSMLETMKFAALVYGLSAQEALDLATIGGAKALRLNAGSIEQGKLADFVLFDANALGTAPAIDPLASIVFSSSPHAVADVVVDGSVVMRDRKILTLNKDGVIENAVKASRRLVK